MSRARSKKQPFAAAVILIMKMKIDGGYSLECILGRLLGRYQTVYRRGSWTRAKVNDGQLAQLPIEERNGFDFWSESGNAT